MPLFQGPPNKKHPLKASSMHETLARVPCATILVRIVPVFREQNNLVESGIRGNSAGDTVISSRSAGKAQYGSPEVSHEDQLLAPTRKSVPRDEWERVGLFVEPPSYSSGVYDSSRCRPSVAELALYPKRCSNGMLTVRQFLQVRSCLTKRLVFCSNANLPMWCCAGTISTGSTETSRTGA